MKCEPAPRPFRRVSQLHVRRQHSPVALTAPGNDRSVGAAACGEGVLGGLDLRDVVEPEKIYVFTYLYIYI